MRTNIHLNPVLCGKATGMSDLLLDDPHMAVSVFLLKAKKAYKNFEYRLQYDQRLEMREEALNNLAVWLKACVEVLTRHSWIHEYFDKSQELQPNFRALLRQSNSLLSFMAQVVTELRREVEDIHTRELMVTYAEFIARLAISLTGPYESKGGLHPHAGHWHHILAATQKLLAKLWQKSASLVEAQARKLDQLKSKEAPQSK